MNNAELVKWLSNELSNLVGCEINNEYSKNILAIENADEIKEFIGSLLDLSVSKNKNFLDELIKRTKKSSSYPEATVYRKPEAEETFGKTKFSKKQIRPEADESPNKQVIKKPAQTDLNPKSNRHACQCQAVRHKLIANCLKCGRIVCESEGSGPCYFCGNLVCTKEEFEKIRSGSRKGENLKEELMKKAWNRADTLSDDLKSLKLTRYSNDEATNDALLKKAIEHKNKLIDFDRTSAKRTQVIDDESDYFNTNSKWLNQKQRTILEKKEDEHRDKRFVSKLTNRTFTLDFAGRKVVDDQENIDLTVKTSEIDAVLSEKPNFQENKVLNQEMSNFAPKFIEDKSEKKQTSRKIVVEKENKNNILRIQDQEFQEMRDEGMCLSMHQPWASLDEGRSWYTPYRGRLWIQAGSKQPSELDISEVESFYKHYYSNQNIEFPSSYPTSCLLGYVDLADCLSQDSYREIFPNGESDSEYVFICKNARELVTKIPMSGQHKIFKLDKNVHSVAKKASVIYPIDES